MIAALAQPRLRVFAGPNGSGKSTIQHLLRPRWIGAYVNADDIERSLGSVDGLRLADFGLSTEPAVLRRRLADHLHGSGFLRKHGLEGVAGHLTLASDAALRLPRGAINSYVAAVLADAIRRELLAQGSTFTFETVMSSPDKIAFMRDAQEQGYRTYLYFVATDDPAINIQRVKLRVQQGGHDVPEDKIRSRYRRSIDLLDAACTAANRAYIFDNSGKAHQWIAEVTDGDELQLHAREMPAWFVRTALWQSFEPHP
ncbi:zeta toxin family protein [Xylophilus sp. GOD-11R]|uniref:zeta toxin family protein n=1 Tax=Xylophilus sp. GOD-11R TaxID=3089814 RepID=UPI00298CD63F|nr:zeta toxin family protein [Xylophilus sp. GOD-11R]WPB57776.1 zeta toxin family protein [Xylophilus sp. GOD-11R]